MKHCYRTFLLLTLMASLYQPAFSQKPAAERRQIAEEMKASMVNELLKQWYPRSIDTLYGGFLSAFTYDFKPAANQDKMIVTQARHVWSNAKAAQLFPHVNYYRKGASHGFDFLKNVFWDKQYGGFYTFTDRQGKVKESNFAPKEGYGNSFGLYALAAFYQLTGDTAVLNLAKKEFMWLEAHSHDPIHKGYFQHMEIDGTPAIRDSGEPSTSARGYKDQNTSIHLLESFTELYNVWPDSLLRERLQEMLFLIRDKMVTPKGYLTLFFTRDWTPVSTRDSSEAAVLKHRNLDHVSFGHDVETAYLMLDASHVLGFKNDTTTLRIAKKMVDHALDNGWDKEVGGFYDEGYYFKDKPSITIIADTKNWWAQAEGLNSLLMMSDYYPQDAQRYYEKFKMLWNYVKTYLIDHEYGDWYQGGLDKDAKQKTALKGHIWKATYHNLRGLMHCIHRLEPDKIPPSIPYNLKVRAQKNFLTFSWSAARDNKALMGYNLYRGNLKIGFTPLTSFILEDTRVEKGSSFSVTAVDLEGNESGRSLGH